MSIPPKYAGLKLVPSGGDEEKHTLEIFVDYVCPFSAKMFKTFYDSVIPMIKESYTPKLQVIFRPQIQPWHPASTLTHEAAVAVLRLAPSKFWDFSDALFREQKEFFDEIVVNETRNETYGRLARLAAKVAGIEEQEMMSMLQISDAPSADEAVNVGNQVTNDLKYLTKANRVLGVHVTPTVFFNGVEERSIDSSFTPEQWEEWLQKSVV